MRQPRPYQKTAIESLDAPYDGDRQVLVMPTGAGKTFTVCRWLRDRLASGSQERFWILCHQEPLPEQWGDALALEGIYFDVVVSAETKKTFSEDARKFLAVGAQVTIVMTPTLTNRLKGIADFRLPDYVLQDEAHLTSEKSQKIVAGLFHRCREARAIADANVAGCRVVGITATPAFHPSSKVTFDQIYPKEGWIMPITPAELIAQNYWKPVNYHPGSTEYGVTVARAMAGIEIDALTGEPESTRMSDVMRSLIDAHISEWESIQEDLSSPTVWACVDRAHAKEMRDRLIARGYTAQAVYSGADGADGAKYEEIPSQAAMTSINTGLIQHTCLVGRLQAGADLRPKCQKFHIVLCRLFGSAAGLEQLMGRGTRPCEYAPDEWATLEILDLARNAGEHGLPFSIDWYQYRQSRRQIQDTRSVHCQSCGVYHLSTPKPRHPIDPLISLSTDTGLYRDGSEVELDAPISCTCGAPVTYNPELLNSYGSWLQENKVLLSSGSPPKRAPSLLKKFGIGISIGKKERNYTEALTYGIMAQLGIWGLTDEAGEKDICAIDHKKDRSEEWERLCKGLDDHRSALDKRTRRVELLPDGLKFIAPLASSQLLPGPSTTQAQSLRRLVVSAYLSSVSPTLAFIAMNGPGDFKAKNAMFRKACTEAIQAIAVSPEANRELYLWLSTLREQLTADGASKFKISTVNWMLSQVKDSIAIAG